MVKTKKVTELLNNLELNIIDFNSHMVKLDMSVKIFNKQME
jgi:hypothetical protein